MLSRYPLPSRSLFSHAWSTLSSPAQFHTTAICNNGDVDYYEILGLERGASSGAIKKKFYSLSSIHHPDHNPDDPEASDRFVKISEAYRVLGVPEKRERYDRETGGSPRQQSLRRSTHSTSTPFGSRPASGLSRRRSQFRGPPPSFFRNGAWGSQGAKRSTQARPATDATAKERADPTQATYHQGSGAAPEGFGTRSFNDVPHFDREGHFQAQEQQEQRRKRRVQNDSFYQDRDRSTLLKFLLVSGVVTLAYGFSPELQHKRSYTRGKESTEVSQVTKYSLDQPK